MRHPRIIWAPSDYPAFAGGVRLPVAPVRLLGRQARRLHKRPKLLILVVRAYETLCTVDCGVAFCLGALI